MAISKEDALKVLLEDERQTSREIRERLNEMEICLDFVLRATGFDPDNLPDKESPDMPKFVLKRIYGLKPRNKTKRTFTKKIK